jgi:tetratricopeptide (TPR) repeat protein
MSLPPLRTLDRQATTLRIGAKLASTDATDAVSEARRVMGENPLAIFGWLLCDGIQPAYLLDSAQHRHIYGGLTVLFKQWTEVDFQPQSARERLAAQALTSQIDYLQTAFQRLATLDEQTRKAARAAHRAGSQAVLAREQGSRRQLLDLLEAAGHHWREAGEPALAAIAEADFAAQLEAVGEIIHAQDLMAGAVAIAEMTGDLERLGRRLLFRGKLQHRLGHALAAFDDYTRAGGVFQVTSEAEQLAIAMLAAGEVAAELGDSAQALPHLDAALVIARQIGDRELAEMVSSTLAGVTGNANR